MPLEELSAVVSELATHVRALQAPAMEHHRKHPCLYHRAPGFRAAMPEQYGGDPAGFLLACELYLQEFPDLTPQQRVSTAIQCFTGRVLDWAIAI